MISGARSTRGVIVMTMSLLRILLLRRGEEAAEDGDEPDERQPRAAIGLAVLAEMEAIIIVFPFGMRATPSILRCVKMGVSGSGPAARSFVSMVIVTCTSWFG